MKRNQCLNNYRRTVYYVYMTSKNILILTSDLWRHGNAVVVVRFVGYDFLLRFPVLTESYRKKERSSPIDCINLQLGCRYSLSLPGASLRLVDALFGYVL
jgi:hypothetical protein